MKLSFSNIALPSFDHTAELVHLAGFGVSGLEVSPSKVWQDTKAVRPADADAYRKQAEAAGLAIVGIHSLFFDQPHMGVFKAEPVVRETLDHLVHLSAICSDLGGKIIVFGSGNARRRGYIPPEEADAKFLDFFNVLAQRTEGHGTCFVIEALGPDETDYINSMAHATRLVETLQSPQLRSHIDLKAALVADELNLPSFQAVADTLEHVHINEPGLVGLGTTGKIDHAATASLLRTIGYTGYCSIEQRMLDPDDSLGPLKQSIRLLQEHYS